MADSSDRRPRRIVVTRPCERSGDAAAVALLVLRLEERDLTRCSGRATRRWPAEMRSSIRGLAPAPSRREFGRSWPFAPRIQARYQLLFQRTLPGFVPSANSYSVAERILERAYESLAANGVTTPEHRDLYTAWTSGLADQQIANDPGGERWLRLVDEAVDMFLSHVSRSTQSTRKGIPS